MLKMTMIVMVLAALGCGGGGSKPAAEPAPPPPPPEPEKVSITGAPACDALIEIQRCMARDVPEALKAVEDSAAAWRDAVAHADVREMVVDTCDESFVQMDEAAASVGCASDYEPPPGTRERVLAEREHGGLTGEPTCDELIVLAMCTTRDDPQGRAGVEQSLAQLRDALAEASSRQTAIDACAQALPEVRKAAATIGCGGRTGAIECDELLDIQRCMAKDVPEAMQAIEDSTSAWRDAIANEHSRQMTIDTCKQSLGQMREAAKSVGC